MRSIHVLGRLLSVLHLAAPVSDRHVCRLPAQVVAEQTDFRLAGLAAGALVVPGAVLGSLRRSLGREVTGEVTGEVTERSRRGHGG